MKKIELKVNINCQKCKTQVLKAVTKLEGIDEVAVDAEKGIVTVIGEADPVRVTDQIRRTGKVADLISVGSPKKPESPVRKPDSPPIIDSPKPEPFPPPCSACQVVNIYDPYEFGGRICTIL